jgi:preprotein translocase subunit SecG
MVILLTIIHIVVCVFLVVVVLLQSGKAADLAGAFGGMGSQTVFGPRGSATVLSKATTIAAALFMCTSLTLSIMAQRAGRGTPSLFNKTAKPVPAQSAPGPAQTAPGGIPANPAGGSVPITVTPSTDGQKGQPQNIQVPVTQGNPNAQPTKKK